MPTVDEVVGQLSDLKVSDLVILSKRLETEWGVSARQAVMIEPDGPTVSFDPVEEQTEFDVRLTEIGPRKIEVIKVVRELLPNLMLVEAKNLVESTPVDILNGFARAESDQAAERLRAVGATVAVN